MKNISWKENKNMDPVIAAPKSHQVLFENQSLRVVKVTILPKQKEPVHAHKWKSLMIVYSSTRLRYFDQKGKAKDYPQRNVTLDNPFVEELKPEAPHAVENLSNHDYQVLRIEFKE